jgi:hypothetical protein
MALCLVLSVSVACSPLLALRLRRNLMAGTCRSSSVTDPLPVSALLANPLRLSSLCLCCCCQTASAVSLWRRRGGSSVTPVCLCSFVAVSVSVSV